jgi:hypothetical protein
MRRDSKEFRAKSHIYGQIRVDLSCTTITRVGKQAVPVLVS